MYHISTSRGSLFRFIIRLDNSCRQDGTMPLQGILLCVKNIYFPLVFSLVLMYTEIYHNSSVLVQIDWLLQ